MASKYKGTAKSFYIHPIAPKLSSKSTAQNHLAFAPSNFPRPRKKCPIITITITRNNIHFPQRPVSSIPMALLGIILLPPIMLPHPLIITNSIQSEMALTAILLVVAAAAIISKMAQAPGVPKVGWPNIAERIPPATPNPPSSQPMGMASQSVNSSSSNKNAIGAHPFVLCK
jgi:hypothetical protein